MGEGQKSVPMARSEVCRSIPCQVTVGVALRSPDKGGKLSGDLEGVHRILPFCSINHPVRAAGGNQNQHGAIAGEIALLHVRAKGSDDRAPFFSPPWDRFEISSHPCDRLASPLAEAVPEYRAMMQLLLRKGQVILGLTQVSLSCLRKGASFTTPLKDSGQCDHHRVRASAPFS
jgi:hypothetical protein